MTAFFVGWVERSTYRSNAAGRQELSQAFCFGGYDTNSKLGRVIYLWTV